MVLCIIDGVVHQTIGEEHRVVGHLELADGLANTDFEFLLSLDSVTNAATELLETRRVDEKEVALKCLSVDFNSTFHIDFDDRDLSS